MLSLSAETCLIMPKKYKFQISNILDELLLHVSVLTYRIQEEQYTSFLNGILLVTIQDTSNI
jgi:hypothetical protein